MLSKVCFAIHVGQVDVYFLQFSHDISVASIIKEHVVKVLSCHELYIVQYKAIAYDRVKVYFQDFTLYSFLMT